MVKKDVKIRKNGEIIKKLSEVVIFDNQVYSKNQQFRLFLSSKAGKDAVLKLYKNCNFYGTIQDNETIFFDSLVVPNDYYKFPRLQD
uniref:Uncharacterized protein n=1 Tax=Panagrolaimus sp. JU765 TaxID=591449 RepID=A0AC34QPU3_9BILA